MSSSDDVMAEALSSIARSLERIALLHQTISEDNKTMLELQREQHAMWVRREKSDAERLEEIRLQHMVNALASGLDSVRVRSMAPEADKAIRAVLDILRQADKTIREQRNKAHHALCDRVLKTARREK